MRKLDFYDLPRSLQDRFIESSQGVAVPRPLLVAPESNRESLKWTFACSVVALAWGGFTMLGYGDLASRMALGGAPQLAVHLGLAGMLAFCGLKGYSGSWEASRRPYGMGAFLFPSGVVRAVGSSLIEYDAKAVSSLQTKGARVAIQVDGRSFEFPSPGAHFAEEAVKAFETGASRWRELGEGDALERARLSPLIDSGVPNPLAPTDPHPRPRLLGGAGLLGAVVLLGVALGLAVSYLRTSLGEDALYRAATRANTVESLTAYLARGGQRTDVREFYLPRAELAQAGAKGTVAAIEDFQSRHPGTKIAGEAQALLREALLGDLGRATSQKTLTAIDQFAAANKNVALVASEVAHARRAVITRALAAFQEVANSDNEDLLPFVQHMLAYAEQHGPRILLRIRQDFPQNPESVDNVVMKSKKYYMGRKCLPSQYFLGDYARKREKALGELVQGRLQRAFPPDVLTFELAPLPDRENVELPPVSGPTLTIQHQEKLSGGFVGGAPKTMFMGVAVYMTSVFELPDGMHRDHKWTAWRAPRFSPPGTGKEREMSEVYQDMVMGAYEQYAAHLLRSWFREQ